MINIERLELCETTRRPLRHSSYNHIQTFFSLAQRWSKRQLCLASEKREKDATRSNKDDANGIIRAFQRS